MKYLLATIYRIKMFGKRKRQIRSVTFVQPQKGEAYFYTPIAYATTLQNSKKREKKQIFTDSDLALAGKLKLIFEREKMVWLEIKEETKKTLPKEQRLFALYYYPHRLVASRASSFPEKATLLEIKKMFNFFVSQDQTRFAKIEQKKSLLVYGSIVGESNEESETIPIIVPK
jgi:hypothetical protein